MRRFVLNPGVGFVLASLAGSAVSLAVTVTVPGYADPWLSGAGAGTTASAPGLSVVPAQSPRLVSGLTLTPGRPIRIIATGRVNLGGPINYTPDGGFNDTLHAAGAENGIGTIAAPAGSLIGVFLGDGDPSSTAAPAGLDFWDFTSRDQFVLAPQLKQPFFVGDGKDASGAAQYFMVPAGATRLYLGVLDSNDYGNNTGSFSVSVTNGECRADFNLSGEVTIQDLFDFLADYFAGCP